MSVRVAVDRESTGGKFRHTLELVVYLMSHVQGHVFIEYALRRALGNPLTESRAIDFFIYEGGFCREGLALSLSMCVNTASKENIQLVYSRIIYLGKYSPVPTKRGTRMLSTRLRG